MSTPQPSGSSDPDTSFKVYKPASNDTAPTPLPPLPDTYFNPSAADLRATQSHLSSRAGYDAPLQLQRGTPAEEKRKRNLERWPQTTLRIRFPSSTTPLLEKSFSSQDKIKAVYAWIRGLLREDVRDAVKFVLYLPPVQFLRVSDASVRDKTLYDLGLTPSTILSLRFVPNDISKTAPPTATDPSQAPTNPSEAIAATLNSTSGVQPPIRDEIWALAEDLPRAPDLAIDDQATSAAKGGDTAGNKTSNSTSSKEKKIPKWLQKGLLKK